VTFPLASLLVVIFIPTVIFMVIKLWSTRKYFLSYLSHFCPTRVSTVCRPYYLCFRVQYDERSSISHTKYDWGFSHMPACGTAYCVPNRVQYRDLGYVQPLARMVALLELFRTFIRPFSLSLRLCANISCRHILAVLSSGPAVPFSLLFLGPVSFIFVLETLVCFVQCYVFYTLWRMYVSE